MSPRLGARSSFCETSSSNVQALVCDRDRSQAMVIADDMILACACEPRSIAETNAITSTITLTFAIATANTHTISKTTTAFTTCTSTAPTTTTTITITTTNASTTATTAISGTSPTVAYSQQNQTTHKSYVTSHVRQIWCTAFFTTSAANANTTNATIAIVLVVVVI